VGWILLSSQAKESGGWLNFLLIKWKSQYLNLSPNFIIKTSWADVVPCLTLKNPQAPPHLLRDGSCPSTDKNSRWNLRHQYLRMWLYLETGFLQCNIVIRVGSNPIWVLSLTKRKAGHRDTHKRKKMRSDRDQIAIHSQRERPQREPGPPVSRTKAVSLCYLGSPVLSDFVIALAHGDYIAF
jgi:hypothetical protein